MRAVRVTGPGTVELREGDPSPEGVRVKVTSAGICRSDLALAATGLPAATLGDKTGGIPREITPVVVEPIAICRRCDACREGHLQRCSEVLDRIYGVSLSGGMADELTVDVHCLIPISTQIGPSDAALIEPLSVGFTASIARTSRPVNESSSWAVARWGCARWPLLGT
jgi:threonine dehydrogenase-like Zn-dependent dehydrogenase